MNKTIEMKKCFNSFFFMALQKKNSKNPMKKPRNVYFVHKTTEAETPIIIHWMKEILLLEINDFSPMYKTNAIIGSENSSAEPPWEKAGAQ